MSSNCNTNLVWATVQMIHGGRTEAREKLVKRNFQWGYGVEVSIFSHTVMFQLGMSLAVTIINLGEETGSLFQSSLLLQLTLFDQVFWWLLQMLIFMVIWLVVNSFLPLVMQGMTYVYFLKPWLWLAMTLKTSRWDIWRNLQGCFASSLSLLQNFLTADRFKGIYALNTKNVNQWRWMAAIRNWAAVVGHYLMCGQVAFIEINATE